MPLKFVIWGKSELRDKKIFMNVKYIVNNVQYMAVVMALHKCFICPEGTIKNLIPLLGW